MAPRATLSPWAKVWLGVFACAWGGNHFTPLLLLYREEFGYSAVTVNVFLAVYVLGLAPGFLLAGPLSNRWGRRPTLLIALAATITGSAILGAGGALPLVVDLGRLFSGFAVGSAMAVGTTWIKELSQAPWDRHAAAGSGAWRGSLGFTIGSGLGAGIAGSLAQWAPLPTMLAYIVHVLVSVVGVLLVLRAPETRSGGSDRSLRDELRTPIVRHPRMTRFVLPAVIWIFAGSSLAYGYLPQVLSATVGDLDLAYATLLTVLALGVSSVVQPYAKRLERPHRSWGIPVFLAVTALGLGLGALAAGLASWAAGIVAAVVLGVGFGIGLVAALTEVQRIAPPRQLAGLTGIFYAVAYIGFATPALAASVTPPLDHVTVFAGLAVLALGSTALALVFSRRPTTP